MDTLQYLQFDPIRMDQKVARLLSPELVHRYHALPVAVDGSKITVAMAYPEDSTARDGIFKALGPDICIIQANPQVVDTLIQDLWPETSQPQLQILSWSFACKGTNRLEIYAQEFTNLLGANLKTVTSSQCGIQPIRNLYKAATNSYLDMVILCYPDQPLMKRLILDLVELYFLDRIPASLLVVTNDTRWPIQEMLLVVGNEDDKSAVDWTVRLAQLTGARVTILPQVPVPPLMFANIHRMLNPGELLNSNCPLGTKLRKITHQFNDNDIQGILRIRHEPVDQQVHCEIFENQYDLVVIAAKPQNLVERWMIGEVNNPIIHCASVPILMAKPKDKETA